MTTNRFNNLYRAAQRQTTTSAKVSYILDIFNNTNNYYTVAQARTIDPVGFLVKQTGFILQNNLTGELPILRIFQEYMNYSAAQSSKNELTRFVNSYNGNNPGTVQTAMTDADFNTLYRGVENRWGTWCKVVCID
jgi:hypothetical protein